MRLSGLKRFLLLAVIVFAIFFAGPSASDPEPIGRNVARGIFSLAPSWTPVASEILANSNVSGIVFRGGWEHVEPNPRQYNTNFIRTELGRARAWGKDVKLEINSGGAGVPNWLLSRVKTFRYRDANQNHDTYGRWITIPLFWDRNFLEYKTSLIRELGKELADHPALTLVSASCANGYTGDWNIPASSGADIAKWRAAGYSDGKLLNACKQVLDATMQAFPDQIVTMAIGRTPGELSSDNDYVARELIDYANWLYPGRFIPMRANLSAATIDPRKTSKLHNWQLVLDNEPNTAGQMLWLAKDTKTCRMNGGRKPCNPAQMLEKAADIGRAFGMRYLEVYGLDIMHPGLASSVRRIASRYR